MMNNKANKGKLKKSVVFIIIAALALLLCGCMKLHIDIVWHEDNSATIDMTVGIKKGMLEMMGTSEEDMQQQLRDGMTDDDYNYETFSDSEYTGVVGKMRIDDITKSTTEAVETLQFRYAEEGKKKTYTVSGTFNGSDLTSGSSELEGVEIDMKMSIEMPGNITSHNATEKKGNKLTWDLSSNPSMTIEATSEVGGGGGMLWLWIAIGAVVLVGGGVVVLLMMRKKKAAPQAGQYTPGVDSYSSPAPGYNPNQAPVAPPQQQPEPPAWSPAPGYTPNQAPVAPPPPPQQPEPPAWGPAPGYTPNQAPVAPPPPPQQAAPPAWSPAPGYTPNQAPAAPPPPPQQAAPPAWGPAPGYTPNQAPVAPPPPPQQAAPPAWGPAPAAGTVQCPQCGKVLPADTRFCSGCGAVITR